MGLNISAGARVLGVSPRSLASRAWRMKLNIPAYRIGRRIVFVEDDLLQWLKRNREGGQEAVRGR